MENIPVKDNPGLVRDSRSGVIKNVDKEAYFTFIANRKKAKDDIEQIECLKNEVSELKKMVFELLNKNNEKG